MDKETVQLLKESNSKLYEELKAKPIESLMPYANKHITIKDAIKSVSFKK